MKIGLIGTAFRRSDPTSLPAELSAVLALETKIAIYPPRLSTFPHNPFDLKIQEIGYIETGLRAAEDGCEVIVLNTVGDYGLAALRSGLRVPVVGAGETGLHVAATLGRPLAIVTIWPESTRFLYEQVVRESGLAADVAVTLHVGSEAELAALGDDDDYVARMQRGEGGLIARVTAACREAQARHGAASILLGCTCMSPIADKVARAVDLPVVNPLTTAVKYAEAIRTLGLRQSPAQYAAANPGRRAVFGAMAEAGAKLAGGSECDVCLVAGE